MSGTRQGGFGSGDQTLIASTDTCSSAARSWMMWTRSQVLGVPGQIARAEFPRVRRLRVIQMTSARVVKSPLAQENSDRFRYRGRHRERSRWYAG